MAFQFSHDSSHGLPSLQAIEGSDHHLLIAEHTIAVFHHKDPENIPWGLTGTHYVIEATGVFTSLSAASRHLSGSQGKRSQGNSLLERIIFHLGGEKQKLIFCKNLGPERVIVGAPSSDVPLYVMGANHEFYRQDALVLSAGSPSIHCLAPLAKLLDDAFGIEEGLGTTIHAASATGTHFQSPHADSGSQSSIDCIIPRPSRGVENLMRQVIPSVAGRIRTMTLRVPTSDVSILDLTLRLKGSPSYAMVMDRIKNASSHSLQVSYHSFFFVFPSHVFFKR